MYYSVDMYYFESIDNTFQFGRYKGYTMEYVLINNPSYLDYCITVINDFMISPNVIEQIKEFFPNFIIPICYSNKIGSYQEYLANRICYNQEYNDDYSENNNYEYNNSNESTYERYNGSWAQDEEDYSDEDIDTIFEGDPSAYWNID